MRDQLQALADHYSAYLNVVDSVARAGPYADYDWGNLPDKMSATWLVYGQMFDEFAREIANTINQLVNKEQRLGAWAQVTRDLDQAAFNEVLMEFVEPLATLALNLPAVIRDRAIFASAHLMHQANQAHGLSEWKDDLPTDRNIKRRDLDRLAGRWKAAPALLSALDRLAAQEDYDAATGNFRNKYHHRFPARVGLGITGIVTREVDWKTKRTRYAIGGVEPLDLATTRRFLGEQIAYAHGVFAAFKTLVREFETAIAAWESAHGNAANPR